MSTPPSPLSSPDVSPPASPRHTTPTSDCTQAAASARDPLPNSLDHTEDYVIMLGKSVLFKSQTPEDRGNLWIREMEGLLYLSDNTIRFPPAHEACIMNIMNMYIGAAKLSQIPIPTQQDCHDVLMLYTRVLLRLATPPNHACDFVAKFVESMGVLMCNQPIDVPAHFLPLALVLTVGMSSLKAIESGERVIEPLTRPPAPHNQAMAMKERLHAQETAIERAVVCVPPAIASVVQGAIARMGTASTQSETDDPDTGHTEGDR